MTQNELRKKLKAIGEISKEQRTKIICSLIGHSNIVDTFFGYVHCSRCNDQVGDALGSYYKNDDMVIQGHKCKACIKNFKRLTWKDKLYVKDPMVEYNSWSTEKDTRKTLLTL